MGDSNEIDMEGESDSSEINSEETSGGWTNEYVREGFDVDGSESRVHPLGMDRRVGLAQAHYEVWRGAWGDGRALYPVVRRLGALFDRERAAEQYIAEVEYLLQQRAAIDRGGIGSKRWWLGMAYFFGWWLLVFAIGVTSLFALLLAVPFVLTTYLGVPSGVAQGLGWLLFLLVGFGPMGWLIYWRLTRRNRASDA